MSPETVQRISEARARIDESIKRLKERSLFACEFGCAEERSMPWNMLRMHDGKPCCEYCYESYTAEESPTWIELPEFDPFATLSRTGLVIEEFVRTLSDGFAKHLIGQRVSPKLRGDSYFGLIGTVVETRAPLISLGVPATCVVRFDNGVTVCKPFDDWRTA